MIKVGEHITLDIIGTDREYDPSVFEKVINEIAKAANVTILNISKYKFEPQGFTILALLAESHISFHTFPEKGIISFDFFTCGKISPSVATDIVKKEFKHKRIVRKEFNRDTRALYHDIYSSPGLQKSYVVNDVLEDFKSTSRNKMNFFFLCPVIIYQNLFSKLYIHFEGSFSNSFFHHQGA